MRRSNGSDTRDYSKLLFFLRGWETFLELYFFIKKLIQVIGVLGFWGFGVLGFWGFG